MKIIKINWYDNYEIDWKNDFYFRRLIGRMIAQPLVKCFYAGRMPVYQALKQWLKKSLKKSIEKVN